MQAQSNPENILKDAKVFAEATGVAFLVLFSTGFLVWHIYLAGLGFDELGLIQTRFILSGFTAWCVLLPFAIAIIWWVKRQFLRWSLCLMILGLFLVLYPTQVFPRISQTVGGGTPRVISLIVTPDELERLSKFGIERGAGSETQTENLCVAYENTDTVIILRHDRVLAWGKNNIRGFGSLPGEETRGYRQYCKELATTWLSR